VLLAGLILGMFFSSLDQTVVGTAMPRIIGELGGLDILTWVTTAYMLSSTAIVPIAGKLADLFGRRMVYIAGLFIFMVGSALCGTSRDMAQLILFRGLQGIGGGIMMPMAMTIVGDIFPPEQRGKWQGVIGALFGLSAIVGPTIGGWFVDNATWRWVFYINLPVGILAAAAIFAGLRGEKRLKEKVVIDYPGALTLTAGIVCLMLGLNLGGKDYPWSSWQIVGLFAASVTFLASFFLLERRAADPILSLDLFKNRVFTVTNMIGFLMGLGMFGAIMFIPLFLQGVAGITATRSGNTMIPMMAAMMLTSVIGGRLITKVRFREMFMAGMIFMTIGFYLMSTMTVDTARWVAMLYIAVLGLGMGTIMPVSAIAVQTAFPKEQRGVATSSTQFFRSIGGTLGMTILGVTLNHRSVGLLQKNFFPLAEKMGYMKGPFGPMLAKAKTDPQSLFNILLRPGVAEKIPGQMLHELKSVLAQSLHTVFLVAAGVVFVGIFTSLLMGNARITKKPHRPMAQEAGMELLAEGVGVEGELLPESEPDVVNGA
jgi:EmrB/QacA subfamily drug resistance transporter